MKRCSSILLIYFLQASIFTGQLCAQDTLLTVEDAVKYTIENNFAVSISRNIVEIGTINNNWANAGAIPVISATANKTIGSNNLQQKLSNGTTTIRNGNVTKNTNAGVAVTWPVFDGFKMFATKRRLEELERNGEYAFRKALNEAVYNVIISYYNVVTIKEQLRSTAEQIALYQERYTLAQRRFEIGTGAKYEVLQAEVDLNEQQSLLLSNQNSLELAKVSLNNLMGKMPDTSYHVVDTIIVHSLPSMADVQNKIEQQNPDILLANSDLKVLFETRKEINAERFPVVTLNGYYNFVRSSNGAGFTLFNQTYGPSGAIGIAVPLFNGGLIKKQVAVTDIQIKNQNITLAETKNNIQATLANAYINYNNSLKIVALENSNLQLASENIFIARERFKTLNITSVELRQVQISYSDAKNRLYTALYNAKIAEAQVALVSGDIGSL
ncbi:MAG: TolC family protein [Ginsengibacter sp.]